MMKHATTFKKNTFLTPAGLASYRVGSRQLKAAAKAPSPGGVWVDVGTWTFGTWMSEKVTPLKTNRNVTLQQSNIAMENPPFEDVVPIQDGDFPLPMFVYRRVHGFS